jgi:hypothetical protein
MRPTVSVTNNAVLPVCEFSPVCEPPPAVRSESPLVIRTESHRERINRLSKDLPLSDATERFNAAVYKKRSKIPPQQQLEPIEEIELDTMKKTDFEPLDYFNIV